MSSGSEKRQRKNRLTIRFTDEEHDVLTSHAERAGISPSSYARKALVGGEAPRAARRPPVEKALLAKTLGELGKIGSNINQVARALNSDQPGGQLSQIETDIRRAATELTVMRNAVLAALGRGKPE